MWGIFSALLGSLAPPVAPADLSAGPETEPERRSAVFGWGAVIILGLLILGSAVSLVAALF